MLCCAVLCRAVLCRAVLCHAVPYHVDSTLHRAQNVAPRQVHPSLSPEAVYCRYCQDVSSKRVPEADFAQELLKALALLSVHPKQKQSGDNTVLKGIAWAQLE